jgi:hypothetical protein
MEQWWSDDKQKTLNKFEKMVCFGTDQNGLNVHRTKQSTMMMTMM